MLEFLRPERLWWLLLIPLLVGLYGFLLWRRKSKARPHAITNLERVLPKQQAVSYTHLPDGEAGGA